MIKYILTFQKTERVKFVSHLDVVRLFSRAARRVGIHITHSQGFNPHPLMTFAHPLGVGIASECEQVEISFDDELSPGEVVSRLNSAMPEGFRILEAKVSEKKSPFASLYSAVYEIELFGSIPAGALEQFLQRETIVMAKKTKSGVKDTDIKEYILNVKLQKMGLDRMCFEAELATGAKNLKPELLLEAMETYVEGLTVEGYRIKRIKLNY